MALTLKQLRSSCTADYQFFRDSILDYSGNGNHLDSTIVPNSPGLIAPKATRVHQSICMGLPCLTIDDPASLPYLTVPFGIAVNTAFSLEYLGVPGRIPNYGGANYNPIVGDMWLIGDNVSHIGLEYDSTGASGVMRARANFGVALPTGNDIWWQDRSPLHLVVARGAGAQANTTIFCQGVPAITGAAGAAAIANPFALFNAAVAPNNLLPFYGCHFRARFFSAALDVADVRYLYQEAQSLMPAAKFPIPVRNT